LELEEDDILVSHDVVSLFTNTPVKESLDIISTRLEQVSDWRGTAMLEGDDILELLEFVLAATCFAFRGGICRRGFGAAVGGPVSPLVAGVFMEQLGRRLSATVPEDLGPGLWRGCVDGTLEVVKRGAVDGLAEFLGDLDDSGSIGFTCEVETEGRLPFLDLLLGRTDGGGLGLSVCGGPARTGRCLCFVSRRPIGRRIGVVGALLEGSQNLVSEPEEKGKEDVRVRDALRTCGCPGWSLRRAGRRMKQVEPERKKRDVAVSGPSVVVPCVERVSGTVARIVGEYGVPCAVGPWVALGGVLVHPGGRGDEGRTTECVCGVPCAGCGRTCIGETGGRLGVGLQEHRSGVESGTDRAFAGGHRSISSAESGGSALADRAVQESRVIGWSAASVVDRESDRSTRWIKEAVHIRREGPRSMSRDEGSCQLSHTYDRFLGSTLTNRAKNRRKKT